MPHEYTRQRQGRDFISQDSDENKKTLQSRLEEYKQESEQKSIPVDGHEPNIGRNLF